MFRVLLFGILAITLGLGLQKGLIEIHWDRVEQELGLPTQPIQGPDPFRSYSKPKQAR
jgi:hypothetical protein